MHGGERGIRTPETLAGLTVFKTVAFDHSAISPRVIVEDYSVYGIVERGFLDCFLQNFNEIVVAW